MRGSVWAAAGVLLTLSLSAGGSAFDSQTCAPMRLAAPEDHLLLAQQAVPDLDWVPIGDLLPGQAPDTHACTGEVRPGARMTNGCTMSWIFRDQAGATYFSTAGHCTSFVGQRVGVSGVGTIGTVKWRVNGGIGNDFALVRVDPGIAVNPTLCHWGGPLFVASSVANFVAGNDLTLHYGWGVSFNHQLTRARAGLAGPGAFLGDGSFRWHGFTSGGDSGSPVMLRDGGAAAVHTHTFLPDVAGFQQKAGTRLDKVIPRVETTLAIDLSLVPGGPVDLTGLNTPDAAPPVPLLGALPAGAASPEPSLS